MVDKQLVPPRAYVPPSSALEIAACKFLFRLMLDNSRIQIDFDPNDLRCDPLGDSQLILAPPRLWTALKIMFAPNLWVGESFVAGAWYLKHGTLSDFLYAITIEAKPRFKRYYDVTSQIRGLRYYIGQYLLNRYYTRKAQRHYDIDSSIYELILDREMLYTCAFFERATDALEEAQQNKIAAVISRMVLPPDQARVLDVGCGWGAMERALVRNHPAVEVCGLSISRNQIEWAKRRDSEQLSPSQTSRIEYRIEDYVDHERCGYYDAVSVIGMIEHVGLGGLDEFFAAINRFLRRGGRAVIHTICAPMPGLPTNNWIDKHIFTGGYAPSISELSKAAERRPFQIDGLFIYPPRHYRQTIEAWYHNLTDNGDKIRMYLRHLKYSEDRIERFIRTWVFYLSGVRNMFVGDQERLHQVVQLVLVKL